MAINIKELDKSIELLLNEIHHFRYQVQSINECEQYQVDLKNKKRLKINNDKTEQTNEEKLQEKETEFDQINELYLRNKNIIENKNIITNMIDNFQNQFSQIINQAEKKKEEYIDQSNDLLIEMKQIERK